MQARSFLSQTSKAWSQLTDADRAAWDAYATAHPIVDRLGQTVALTGHMMFVSVNSVNLQIGVVLQDTVPDGVAIAPPVLTAANVTAAALSITNDDAIPVNTSFIVFCSPPLSQGRKFNGDFRIIATGIGTNAAAQVVATAAEITTKYGTIAVGQKYFISVQLVKDGNLSPQTQIAVVTT